MSPAEAEAMPPAICWIDELTDMKAPRSGAAGTMDVRADAEIMREVTHTMRNTLTTITSQRGERPRWVKTTTVGMLSSVATQKTVYLPTESLSLPTNGPATIETRPVTM